MPDYTHRVYRRSEQRTAGQKVKTHPSQRARKPPHVRRAQPSQVVPRCLHYGSVAHARGAGCLARTADDAGFDVAGVCLIGCDSALGCCPHEVKPSAGRIVFVSEYAVRRAMGKTEAAMNAREEIILLFLHGVWQQTFSFSKHGYFQAASDSFDESAGVEYPERIEGLFHSLHERGGRTGRPPHVNVLFPSGWQLLQDERPARRHHLQADF